MPSRNDRFGRGVAIEQLSGTTALLSYPTYRGQSDGRLVWVGSTSSADGKSVIQGGERRKGSLLPDSRPIPSNRPASGLADEHSASYHSVRLLRSETCRWNSETVNVSLGSGVRVRRFGKLTLGTKPYREAGNRRIADRVVQLLERPLRPTSWSYS